MPRALTGLALSWLLWCALHSLLIHPPIASRVCRWLGRWQKAERLFYNLVAALSLLPVAILYVYAAGEYLLQWPSWALPLKWLCWACAGFMLWAGARAYDLKYFLGVRQLQEDSGTGMPPVSFCKEGILRYTRHPWYLAGFMVLWSRDLAARDLVTAVILSLYLIIGTILEERKLVRLFGDEYRRYQRQVPMFLPLPRHKS